MIRRLVTVAAAAACGIAAYTTATNNDVRVPAGLAIVAVLLLYLAVRRGYCQACGSRGWLVTADDGARIHGRHLRNPRSGYYRAGGNS